MGEDTALRREGICRVLPAVRHDDDQDKRDPSGESSTMLSTAMLSTAMVRTHHTMRQRIEWAV